MKLNHKKISLPASAMAFALIGFALSVQAANLSDQEKEFLTAYGKAHDELVADRRRKKSRSRSRIRRRGFKQKQIDA